MLETVEKLKDVLHWVVRVAVARDLSDSLWTVYRSFASEWVSVSIVSMVGKMSPVCK